MLLGTVAIISAQPVGPPAHTRLNGTNSWCISLRNSFFSGLFYYWEDSATWLGYRRTIWERCRPAEIEGIGGCGPARLRGIDMSVDHEGLVAAVFGIVTTPAEIFA